MRPKGEGGADKERGLHCTKCKGGLVHMTAHLADPGPNHQPTNSTAGCTP